MFVPLGGVAFLMSLFVEDKGLPDDAPKEVAVVDSPAQAAEDIMNIQRTRMDSEITEDIPIREKLESGSLDKKEKDSVIEETVGIE